MKTANTEEPTGADPTEVPFVAIASGDHERMERLLVRLGHSHRVFVYGTLITGERNADWARNARRQKAWTTGTIYDTGRSYPAFVKGGGTRIAGEVLTVGDEGLRLMDRLEGYPRLYRREEIEATLADGGHVKAWVYIMNDLPPNAKVIEGGDWVAYRKAKDAAWLAACNRQ